MTGRWWAAARVAGGLAVLGVLAAQVGTGPFVTGLRAVGPGPRRSRWRWLARTTLCSAQRWRLVARSYGVDVRLRRGDRGAVAVGLPHAASAPWRPL